MPYGLREGERFIDARFSLDRERHGYSAVYLTTDSRDLSSEFGLRLGRQTPTQARQRMQLGRYFSACSHETNKVNAYFIDLALKGGWFIALPYDEIPQATNGQINEGDLKRAVKEGFLQRARYPGVEKELAELTTKIVPTY